MFGIIKPSRFVSLCNFLLNNRRNLLLKSRPFTCCSCKAKLNFTPLKLNITNDDPYKIILREKSNKKKTKQERQTEEEKEEEDESDEDDNEYQFKGDEVKTYDIQAPRVDKIVKVCFKSSRKNIEDIFYQNRIRVNGKILKKKSANANIGDEIDIINNIVNDNSRLLNINRIEILNIKGDPENLKCSIKVKKSKSLTVENYTGSDEWKG